MSIVRSSIRRRWRRRSWWRCPPSSPLLSLQPTRSVWSRFSLWRTSTILRFWRTPWCHHPEHQGPSLNQWPLRRALALVHSTDSLRAHHHPQAPRQVLDPGHSALREHQCPWQALWFHLPLHRPGGAQVQAHCRSEPQRASTDLQRHHRWGGAQKDASVVTLGAWSAALQLLLDHDVIIIISKKKKAFSLKQQTLSLYFVCLILYVSLHKKLSPLWRQWTKTMRFMIYHGPLFLQGWHKVFTSPSASKSEHKIAYILSQNGSRSERNSNNYFDLLASTR